MNLILLMRKSKYWNFVVAIYVPTYVHIIKKIKIYSNVPLISIKKFKN